MTTTKIVGERAGALIAFEKNHRGVTQTGSMRTTRSGLVIAFALVTGCSAGHSTADTPAEDAGRASPDGSSTGSAGSMGTTDATDATLAPANDVHGDAAGPESDANGDALASGDGSVDEPDGAPARTRPLILIALHGSNGLADNAYWDSQWTYVRAHLDGFWGNNAGITTQEEASLWQKIAGRLLITEWDSVDKAEFVSPQMFTGAEQYLPSDVVIDRQQICLYTATFSDWNGTTIAEAIANYVNNPAVPVAHRFQSVCTGFQPFAPSALTGDALAAFQASAATFVEYPATAWTLGGQKDNFVAAWKATHAKGSRFIWFNSIYSDTTIHDWLASTEIAYGDFKSMGLIQPNDVIMLINYGGRLPSVPEEVDGGPGESTTGIAYWLLHQ